MRLASSSSCVPSSNDDLEKPLKGSRLRCQQRVSLAEPALGPTYLTTPPRQTRVFATVAGHGSERSDMRSQSLGEL